MDAAALTPPIAESPRRPPALALVGAAIAAEVALVFAPAAVHGGLDGPLAIAALAPAPLALIWGLWRASAPALLLALPFGWVLPAYWLPQGAFDGATGAVAVGVAAIWLVVALWWLRAARRADAERAAPAWEALDHGPIRAVERDPTPWVGGVLVAAPALGVALWPPVGVALDAGFPGRVGPAGALLALVGTVIGLAIATDLARGRRPRRGSKERAALLALIVALALALYAAIGD